MDDSAPPEAGSPAGSGEESAAASGAPIAELTKPPRARTAFALGGAFVLAVLLGTLGYFVLLHVMAGGRVLPKVTALGANLTGLDGRELEERIASLEPRAQALAGKVRIQDRTFDVTAAELGLGLDVAETAKRARALGREGSWPARFTWFVRRAVDRAIVPVALRFDEAKVETRLVAMERAALGEPALEGAVTYAGGISLTLPRSGFAVEREGLAARLSAALLAPAPEGRQLPVKATTPRLTAADVQRAAGEAARLIQPVSLKAADGDKTLALSTDALGMALRGKVAGGTPARLEVSLDREALREALAKARPQLEVPPRDATFSVNAKREVSIVPSELGTRLDDDAVLDAIVAAAASTERTGMLAFKTDVVPALTTEQADALHVRALVSSYQTPFPCCEARVKNIERMAALVNGSVIRPGESYSLNARVGPRTAANGFVAGPTIVEGEMELTVGGGVSQFATTLFNAAFDGGYEIIQRQAHTFWFPRYPEGYDATLGFPLPDLVFRNDTEAAIFIKTEVGKTYVRVELYGDNGGRRVQRQPSPRFDTVKPETILEPNPELRPDEEKVKFGGWTGWSLHVARVLTFPDGQKKEERRKVIYSPRARRVEVHPCKIPEGQPGWTGERCPKIEVPDGGAPSR